MGWVVGQRLDGILQLGRRAREDLGRLEVRGVPDRDEGIPHLIRLRLVDGAGLLSFGHRRDQRGEGENAEREPGRAGGAERGPGHGGRGKKLVGYVAREQP